MNVVNLVLFLITVEHLFFQIWQDQGEIQPSTPARADADWQVINFGTKPPAADLALENSLVTRKHSNLLVCYIWSKCIACIASW